MSIDIARALGIAGWMKRIELQWLAERALESETIVEIGSFRGRSTRALADHCRGVVHVVEDWIDTGDHVDQANVELRRAGQMAIEAAWRANLADHLESGRIVLARGNSPDVAPFLATRVGGGADFIFIDGNHSREGVRADLAAYEWLVKPGGILAGHDYTTKAHPGVRLAVDDYFSGRAEQGPGSIWWIRL